jgi:hypothetical protein
MTLAPIDWMMGRHPESRRRPPPHVASAPKLFSKEA